MVQNGNLKKSLFGIGIAIIAINILLLVWSTNKGYDMTDEGFYLNTSFYPADTKFWVSWFFIYTNILLKIKSSIIFIRLLSVVFNFLTTLFMSVSFFKLYNSLNVIKNPDTSITRFTQLYVFVFLFSQFQFIIPVTLNYNSLNAYLLYIYTAFIFTYLRKIGTAKYLYSPICVGIVVGVDLFIKFPTAILLCIIYIVLIVGYEFLSGYSNYKRVIKGLSLFLLGITIAVLVSGALFRDPNIIAHKMRYLNHYQQLDSSHNASLIYTYVKEFIILFHWLLLRFVVILCVLYTVHKIENKFQFLRNKKKLDLILINCLFLCIAAICLLRGASDRIYDVAWISILFFILIFYLILKADFKKIEKIYVSVNIMPYLSLLLFVLPFIASGGTNNNITQHVLLSSATWGILLFILQERLTQLNYGERLVKIVFVSNMLLLNIIFMYSFIFYPYRLFDDYLHQNKRIQIAKFDYLYVDNNTFNIIQKTKNILHQCGFIEGDYVLPLFDNSGLVFAANGRIPGCGWYSAGGGSAIFNEAQYCINISGIKNIDKAFILRMTNVSDGAMDSHLMVNKYIYPDDYHNCGTIKPTSTQYKRGGNFVDTIQVYAPNL